MNYENMSYTVPLSFDESLSVYKQLCTMFTEINNLSEKVNTLNNGILERAKAYTDAEVAEIDDKFTKEMSDYVIKINADIAKIRKEFTDNYTELNQKLSDDVRDINKNVDNKIAAINAESAKLKKLIEYSVKVLNSSMTNLEGNFGKLKIETGDLISKKFREIKEYVDKVLVERSGEYIYVDNPITGLSDSLNNTLEDITRSIKKIGALTVGEYRRAKITVREYREKMFTAYDYAYMARWSLYINIFKDLFNETVNEKTREMCIDIENIKRNTEIWGLEDGVKKSLKDEFVKHMYTHHITDYITAGDYDALNLTAGEYDAMNLTAVEYDAHGKKLKGGI